MNRKKRYDLFKSREYHVYNRCVRDADFNRVRTRGKKANNVSKKISL